MKDRWETGISFEMSRLSRFWRNRKVWFWENFQQTETEEGSIPVVKGISKRVIVVRSPDPRIFEQAIFIVREDYAGENGVNEKDVLRQAMLTAERYLHMEKGTRRWLPRLRGWLCAAGGAAVAALTWWAVRFIL